MAGHLHPDLPGECVADSKVGCFCSVIAVDSLRFNVIPNPSSRFLLNKESGVQDEPGWSLVLYFAPEKPAPRRSLTGCRRRGG